MLHADKDALLCDIAETYHVYDLEALPVLTLAALSVGLRDDSRIKMKLSGLNYIPQYILSAAIADNLILLRYQLTAKKGDPKPDLYSTIITGDTKQKARAEKEKDKKYVSVRDSILNDALRRVEAGNE